MSTPVSPLATAIATAITKDRGYTQGPFYCEYVYHCARLAQGELDKASAGLMWTDTPPTVEGWYWTRDCPPLASSLMRVQYVTQDEVKHPWTVTPVQWAGPVTPPQEPTS